MEFAILWLVLIFIGKAMGESHKNKKQKNTNQARRQQTTETKRAEPKKKGFFGALQEELERLELEEKEKQRQAVQKADQALRQEPPTKKVKQKASLPRDEEEAAEEYLARQEQLRLRDALNQVAMSQTVDDNYRINRNTGFSVQNLQARFPDPAQQMVVLSEIFGKPVSLRNEKR